MENNYPKDINWNAPQEKYDCAIKEAAVESIRKTIHLLSDIPRRKIDKGMEIFLQKDSIRVMETLILHANEKEIKIK